MEGTHHSNITFSEVTENLMATSAWIEELLLNVESIKNSRGANRTREISLLEKKILIKLNTKAHRTTINQKVGELYSLQIGTRKIGINNFEFIG